MENQINIAFVKDNFRSVPVDPKTGQQIMMWNNSISTFFNEWVLDYATIRGRFNYSIQLCTTYEECLGAVANGTIDILEVDFAIDSNYEGIVLPINYLDPNTFEIMTMYNCSKAYSMLKQRKVDIGESIFSFSLPVWTLVFMFIAMIYFIMSCHYKMNGSSSRFKSKYSSAWNTFSYVARQPRMEIFNWMSNYISLLLSIFVFFVIICFFLNVMQSDRVTKHTPTIFNSEADILAEDNVEVQIDYNHQMFFKHYRNDSPVMAIINHAKNNNCLLNYTDAFGTLDKHRVVIQWKKFLNVYLTIGCNTRTQMMSNNHGTCFYVSKNSDIHGKKEVNVYMSSKFISKPINSKYEKYTHILNEMYTKAYFYRIGYDYGYVHVPNDCSSPTVVTHDPEYESYELVNYKFAFLALLIPIICSLFALHFELFKRFNLRASKSKLRVVRRLEVTRLIEIK